MCVFHFLLHIFHIVGNLSAFGKCCKIYDTGIIIQTPRCDDDDGNDDYDDYDDDYDDGDGDGDGDDDE